MLNAPHQFLAFSLAIAPRTTLDLWPAVVSNYALHQPPYKEPANMIRLQPGVEPYNITKVSSATADCTNLSLPQCTATSHTPYLSFVAVCCCTLHNWRTICPHNTRHLSPRLVPYTTFQFSLATMQCISLHSSPVTTYRMTLYRPHRPVCFAQ